MQGQAEGGDQNLHVYRRVVYAGIAVPSGMQAEETGSRLDRNLVPAYLPFLPA